MRILQVAVIVFLLSASLLFAGAPMRMQDRMDDPLVGQSAPQFVLRDQNGRTYGVSMYRGRPALLIFLPAGMMMGASASGEGPAQGIAEAEQLIRKYPRARASGLVIASLGRGGRGDGERPGGGPSGGPGGNRNPRGNQPGVGNTIPPQVLQQLRQIRTNLPMVFDMGGQVAGAYELPRGGLVLVDETGKIRTRVTQANEAARQRLEDQLALMGGEAPEKYGWRSDIVFALEVALGERDRQGRPIMPGKSMQPAPPEVGLRGLQQALPSLEVNVFPNYETVPENMQTAVKSVVEFSRQEWLKALPDLKLNVVDNRDEADLILTFSTEALDPRDQTGVRTVCANYRTLDEEGPSKGVRPGRPGERNEHRIKTIAQIGFGHSTAQIRHSENAVRHLIAGAIGYALGLDDRVDPASVMHPNVDRDNVVVRPSREDLTILKTMPSALYYHIGTLQLQQGRKVQAEQSFAKIDPQSRYAAMVPKG